ncbi:7-carboxy-7-deazaguanine synthase QueE [Limisalsivibrio acetivorans]|uniref:7-carboxy-7-deazaguanine synthase QueE n=1 Tax=Limisalsivibrio acetivorans TaxID=1304888 RepID=UPI0003B5320E|nr:7-carboxy-7-deazaguanine synthase QueE [Limisalsivibrio acetivorans]
MSSKGYIKEVFASIQGEGLFSGARQIFIRFAGCSAGCSYCDTDYEAGETFDFGGLEVENPISASELAELVQDRWEMGEFHSVAFTGGEPLEQKEFLFETASILRENALLMLETSGFNHELIPESAELFDMLSIDVKICEEGWDERLPALLDILNEIPGELYYLKLIADINNTDEDFEFAAGLLSGVFCTGMFLQSVDNSLDFKTIDKIQAIMYKKGAALLYRPQIHKLAGFR